MQNHIAEQLKEVDDVLESYGARPVEWLLQNVEIDSRWCLIHATHMIPEETQNIAKVVSSTFVERPFCHTFMAAPGGLKQ